MQYYYIKLISIPVPGESVESLVVVPFYIYPGSGEFQAAAVRAR